MLESSSYFEKVHTREAMIQRDKDFDRSENIEKIFWTTAVPTSELQFSNGANFKLISKPGGLLGQAQPLDCKIKKPDGSWVTMGSLKTGDKVASPSEGETEVIGVYPQGIQKTYLITLEDGRKTRCNASHKFKVGYKLTPESELITDVVTLQFMMDNPSYEFYLYDIEDCTVPEVPNATYRHPEQAL